MNVRAGIRRLLSRAREEATGLARTASIKLDIRSLEGRRDHLFRQIGREVYDLRAGGMRYAEFEASCEEIDRVEQTLLERSEELRTIRGKPPSSARPAGAETASV